MFNNNVASGGQSVFEWWRRWRRKRTAAKRRTRLRESKGETELREFVYLDSTSVHSLVASRVGPIATEQTENRARKWESKAAGKVGADLAAFDLAAVDIVASAERMSGGSQSVQVLKKSIIQTTFKDLLEIEGDTLLLGGRETRSQRKKRVQADELVRGSLVEVDVELDVEPVFRLATVTSSLIGFVEKSPELFHAVGVTAEQLAQGRALDAVFRGLLGGLVPIQARVLNHRVVRDGSALAVLRSDSDDGTVGEPLFLVGVAEEALFWKDVRRVLFSRGRYKVLARVAEHGICNRWTPIKLEHILNQVIPGFSSQLANWGEVLQTETPTVLPSEHTLQVALDHFIELIKEKVTVDPSRLGAAREYVATLNDTGLEYDSWKAQADKVTELLLGADRSQLSRENVAMLRESAKTWCENTISQRPRQTTPTGGGEPKHFLDCEIVAIYW